MIGSVFVATTILFSKKLQVHPQRLIAYVCLCEAISSFNGVIWTIDTEIVIKYLELEKLLKGTIFYAHLNEDTLRKLLINTNDGSFQFFSLLTLFLNMCLCIDLILTLRNPFYPAKNRMKFYLVPSFLFCLPLAFFTLNSI